MGDVPLDRDARIELSLFSKKRRDPNGLNYEPYGLAFDHHRGILFVVDHNDHRVEAFSCEDGSSVCRFGEFGTLPGRFMRPYGIAIDHDQDCIFITCGDWDGRVHALSLSDQSFLWCIGQRGSGYSEFFRSPRGVAIDKHNHRIIVANTEYNRLVFWSSIDLSFLFEIGSYAEGEPEFDEYEPEPEDFAYPTGIAVDDDRHRIIVTDTYNHRVQARSSIDGSFLFMFGSQGDQPCQFKSPRGVCIANQGRIIVADYYNNRLQAFTHEGHHISSFDCGSERPLAVAFDEHRGLIAFSAGNRVHVIGANQWLADTFTWRPDVHRYAPPWMKQAVSTMTMIRSVVDECSAMSMIPNELLFEIFSHL